MQARFSLPEEGSGYAWICKQPSQRRSQALESRQLLDVHSYGLYVHPLLS
jgi:hypothetical protein